jgi:hypothetical protein
VSLHGKNGLDKKDLKKGDVVTIFWYTLKNLDWDWFHQKQS